MCWEATSIESKIMHSAKDDMSVYKIGFYSSKLDGAVPYYMYHVFNRAYKEGETYSLRDKLTSITRVQKKNCERVIINEGFHSYNPKKTYTKWSKICCYNEFSEQISDFYIMCVEYKYNIDDRECVGMLDTYSPKTHCLMLLECTIPKGTHYYENEKGEIVSEKIRIDKIKPLNYVLDNDL